MKRLFAALVAVLCMIPAATFASPVGYSALLTDVNGNYVAGATWVINSTTLTAGTVATGLSGDSLTSSSSVTGASITYYDKGNGYYTFVYDPALTGEAHFTATASKSNTALLNSGIVHLTFTADSYLIVSTNTRATTALPNAAPGGNGGVPIANGSNQVAISNALPALDGSNRVLLQPTQTGVTIPAVTMTGSVTGDVQGKVLGGGSSTITGNGVNVANFPATVSLSSGDETHLANADTQSGTSATQSTAANSGVSALSTKIGTPAGASVSADIATANTAIAALPTTTAIANAVLGATIDGSITMKQAQALQIAIMTGKYTTSTTGGVTTTTYYRQDGTTVLAVSTLTSSNGTTTRTWTFSNLP